VRDLFRWKLGKGLMVGCRYMCKDPKEIKFAPLNKDVESTAEELMTIYEVSYIDHEIELNQLNSRVER
jgi:hypothetical protein